VSRRVDPFLAFTPVRTLTSIFPFFRRSLTSKQTELDSALEELSVVKPQLSAAEENLETLRTRVREEGTRQEQETQELQRQILSTNKRRRDVFEEIGVSGYIYLFSLSSREKGD